LSGLRTEESILHTQQNIPHQLNVEKGNQLWHGGVQTVKKDTRTRGHICVKSLQGHLEFRLFSFLLFFCSSWVTLDSDYGTAKKVLVLPLWRA
jgi:hypothetical protein